MTSKRNPFIEGFREPTLSKNSFLSLADVRGDGQGKLVIWSEEQKQLIVYKGSNRELEKDVKLKNVSGIIQYQDQERNAQAVIGLSSQNGFYIFRSLSESYRLRVPDINATEDEQVIWSQYENQPEKLGSALQKIDKKLLTETAKYFLSSETIERKKELISKVFSEGIHQKDSIASMALLRHSDNNFLGNVILGTQLQRMYILDEYGHSIISTRIIPVVPAIMLGYGKMREKYLIIIFGRQGDICIYLNNDEDEPSERIKNNTRIISACLSFPDLLVVGADQTLSHYVLSNSTFKLMARRYKMKLGAQPLKVQFMRVKGQKITILAFEKQIRFYNEKQLNYTYQTDFILYNVLWGSFARQQNCLILLYENAGFEVLILHRQFKVTQKYGSNKEIKKQYQSIPVPKKTPHFLSFWNDSETDETHLYKHYEKSLKLLKWRTLREKFTQGGAKAQSRIEVNSKILGLGPIFNIQLQLQNLSDEIQFSVGLMINFDQDNLELIRWENTISMLAPFTPTVIQLQIRSLSLKNETVTVEIISGDNVTSSVVFIPNCQEFGQV